MVKPMNLTESAFQRAIERMASTYPAIGQLQQEDQKEACYSLWYALQEEAVIAGVIPAGEEQIRITRIYVFDGPRKLVERQVAHSLPDGTKQGWGGGVKIHVATVGQFPEILTPGVQS